MGLETPRNKEQSLNFFCYNSVKKASSFSQTISRGNQCVKMKQSRFFDDAKDESRSLLGSQKEDIS